jgi:hypothetical protein
VPEQRWTCLNSAAVQALVLEVRRGLCSEVAGPGVDSAGYIVDDELSRENSTLHVRWLCVEDYNVCIV